MTNKKYLFLILIISSSLVMVLADFLILIFFGHSLSSIFLKLSLPALGFLALYIFILGRNARCFAQNFFDGVENNMFYARLKKLGSVPIKMIGLNVAVHAVFLSSVYFINGYLEIDNSMRGMLYITSLAFGILVGTIVYVVSDGLVSLTLIGHNFTSYPRNLREGRQALKAIIVPLTVAVLGVLFTSSVTMLSMRFEGNMMLYIPVTVFLLCIAFLGIQLKKNTTRVFASVIEQLENLSSDQKDITKRVTVCSVDELGTITGMVNTFCSQLNNGIRNIKKESFFLSDIVNDLASNMNETAAAVNEINANIQNIKTRVLNQSSSVSETHATMKQLVGYINKLNGHVEKQSGNITQASSAIEEMVANIQSVTGTLTNNAANTHTLREAAEAGHTGLQEVASHIQEVSHESDGLLEINSVMANIASQTNLLSMNAAIEAAHAGEAGKGFAVVADEIRKLAENSSRQSKTIGSVLKKIKGSIDLITHSTENVLNKFEAIDLSVNTVADQEENLRYSMEEQGQGNKLLLERVTEINEITHKVSSGSIEMYEGAKEVISESENLDRSTQEISSGMNEMAVGAEHINLAVNHVSEISIKNREAINVLLKEVDCFKVD
ncbi:MAG: methyl-accepting chemotaxis protein [Treponema sp.]|nr:methyl-accepting chemotaxis protein [Treponema sp.]